MKDQVDSLNELGINAAFINSTLDNSEFLQILEGIRANSYKIVYVAPERLNTDSFINLVKDIRNLLWQLMRLTVSVSGGMILGRAILRFLDLLIL